MATENTSLPPADSMPGIESGSALPDSAVPVHVLDADNYMANDLDGITESLFGSGNLNYLLLQGRQSDAAGVAGGFDGLAPSEIESLTALAALMNAGRAFGDAADLENALSTRGTTDPNAQGATANNLFANGGNAFQGDAFDNLRALANESVLNIDPPPAGPPNDDPPDDDPPDDDPPDDDPPDNDPPDDDPPDDDPPDDDPPGGEDDIDVLGTNDVNLPEVDINLDPLEDIVGDIDVGVDISHGDDGITIGVDTVLLDIPVLDATVNLDIPLVNPVLDTVLDITDPVLGGVTETVQPVVDGIGDTVESIIDSLLGQPPADDGDVDLAVHQDLGLPQIDVNLDVVEDIVGDIDIAADIDRTDDGISLDVGTIVADIPLANADVDLDVPIVMPVVNEVVDPVADLLDNVTSAETLENLVDNPVETLGNIVEDTVETVGDVIEGAVTGLQEALEETLSQVGQQDTSADDVDISISTPLGLPPIEISLDPLEALTGDIDLDLGLTESDGSLGLDLDSVVAGIDLTEGQILGVDVPIIAPTLDALLDPTATPKETLENTLDSTVGSVENTLEDITDVVANIGDTLQTGADNITGGLEDGLGVIGDTVENGILGGELLDEMADGLSGLGMADSDPEDTDIDISNNIDIPQIDIVLDTIEGITGDIDVGLDVGLDDGGITLDVDLTVLGVDLTNGAQEVNIPLATPVVNDLLDVTSEILGTAADNDTEAAGAMGLIDSVLESAEDLLSTALGGITNGGEEASWPILNTDGAGGIAGVAEGIGLLGSDTGDGLNLLDPIGDLTEGFGLLSGGNNDHDQGGGSLSGLGNGLLGGGLFG